MKNTFCFAALLWLLSALSLAHAQPPQTVTFDSADAKLKLTGYLYLPDPKAWPGRRPAIVMLHGRSGVFASNAKQFDATTLSTRVVLWGKFWAQRGYVGMYVDTFGPRGYPKGFEAGTNRAGQRPSEVNEITVRPLDAYKGLQYLRSRMDVQTDRVFLQGWSNGGSAALSTMAEATVGMDKPTPDTGFRAAIAVYPACGGVSGRYGNTFRSYAPVLLLIGTRDEEVSFQKCEQLANTSRKGDIEFIRYEGAMHSYDTPSAKRLAVSANVAAAEDTMKRAEAHFKQFLVPAK